jgi:uncharacterized protein
LQLLYILEIPRNYSYSIKAATVIGAKMHKDKLHKAIIKIFFYTCSILALFPSKYVYADNNIVLNFATGNSLGVYYPLGKGISEIVKAKGIDLNVLTSEGSIENLRWLSNNKAQLCLSQSDTVYNAYNGLGGFNEKISNIKAFGSLYNEVVHILVRSSLSLKKIEDFKGKRISVGPKGGGTELNAITILESAGISSNEIKVMNLEFDSAVNALKENEVDIVFFISGYPSDGIQNAISSNAAVLFELQPDTLSHLVDKYSYFLVLEIPALTYSGQNDDIMTLGIPALLVGQDSLDDELVYRITKTVFDNTKALNRYHIKGKEIELSSALRGVTIPLFEGSKKFYKEKGLYRNELFKKIFSIFIIVLAVISLLFCIKRYRNIRFFFKTKPFARIFVVLAVILFVGSMVLYFAEHKINENYSDPLTSCWSSFINWLNFGTYVPITTTGRIASVLMTITGIGGIAWFTGEIASRLLQSKLTGGKRKMEKISDHYVIINWGGKVNRIIEQLHSDVFVNQRPIIVVNDSDQSVTFPPKLEYETVYIVNGNPTNEATLRNANVYNARSVIILASETGSPEVTDAKTILIILSIRKLCLDNKVKQVPMIAEIIAPDKVSLASYAGIVGNGELEIVSAQEISQGLIIQTAVNPGLSKVYKELLSYSKEDCEIYKAELPLEYIGKSFTEFAKGIVDLKNKGVNVIPIGIYRDGKVYLNPKKEKLDLLQQGDMFFGITYDETELKKIY